MNRASPKSGRGEEQNKRPPPHRGQEEKRLPKAHMCVTTIHFSMFLKHNIAISLKKIQQICTSLLCKLVYIFPCAIKMDKNKSGNRNELIVL